MRAVLAWWNLFRVRRLSWILGVTGLALLLVGCESSTSQVPVVRLGHAPHDHHSPLYVAAMNPEYFAAHGGIWLREIRFRQEYELIREDQVLARVLIESNSGGGELIRRLSGQQYDLAFGGVPAMVKFIDAGAPIHILAPVMAEGAGLVVRPDLPIDDWAGFIDYVRGEHPPLRIGYKVSLSVQGLIFKSALEAEGVRFGTDLGETGHPVILVNLHGANNLIPALRDGFIDGFVVMQPFLAMAEHSGVGKRVAFLQEMSPAGQWVGHPCCALAAHDDFIAREPEVLTALLALFERARAYLAEDSARAAGQVARWLDVDPAIEAQALPSICFDVSLNEDWNQGVEYWVRSMIEDGELSGELESAWHEGRLHERIYRRLPELVTEQDTR